MTDVISKGAAQEPREGPASLAAMAVGPVPTPRWGTHSGAAVGLLFHRALAAVFLIAWLSLASQILVLVGSRGLLPLVDFVAAARADGALSFRTFPSLLAWMPGDRPLFWGTLVGAAVSLVALSGARPRLCAAFQTVWYLGYVTICRDFLGFQWDNLLLECGLLATFLPAHRPAPLAHLMLRALLFKLYFESGLAKWQSPLHDWRDGSAMSFYYETAPLPTALAWYAHHLPRGWHAFESYATLAMELVLPFGIFGPRRIRLGAAALLTLFQVINLATANYAFFCYLTMALHVFLLDEHDVTAIGKWRRRPKRAIANGPPGLRRPIRVAAWVGAGLWAFVSLTEAWFHFGEPSGEAATILVPVLEWSQTFRVVNAFHLFAAVTRERIEPEVQLLHHGVWTAQYFKFKPGDPARAPRLVAPHQPRVDFLLWFYGLSYQRRQPAYVAALQARLCDDPAAVASLFGSDLPSAPSAVRIVFWAYRFTSIAERNATGAWWTRRPLGATQPSACDPR